MKKTIIMSSLVLGTLGMLVGCSDNTEKKSTSEVSSEAKQISDEKAIEKLFTNYETSYVKDDTDDVIKLTVKKTALEEYFKFFKNMLNNLKEKDKKKYLEFKFNIESKEKIAIEKNYAAYYVEERTQYSTTNKDINYSEDIYYILKKDNGEWKLYERLTPDDINDENKILEPYLTEKAK